MRKSVIEQNKFNSSATADWKLHRQYIVTIVLAVLFWTESEVAAETRVVTADPTLAAGPVHRFLFGEDYRDLWTTPIEVEVLDLNREAGGLKPLFRVGGAQTFGLAMKGADGRSYTFRSVRKELTQNLSESLRDNVIGRIFQDQQASIHPASNVIVPPLSKAAGILHNSPRLIVLPDDPALGEFREVFAGRLGTIEEFPTEASDEYEGFHGATEIIKSNDIVPLWLASPEVRVDARELLRIRLFDFFLGDWDRHANNYRWAKLPDQTAWQPIAEDRDQAFVDFQGFAIALTRPFEPRVLRFKERYPSNIGLTLQGWPIHRWFLAELDRTAWNEIATDLGNRLTDDVIDEAVSLMPKAYFELNADKLARTLRARRDKLPEIAERIYRYTSAEVDVQATDKSDRIDLRYLGQGRIEVNLALENSDTPYFTRELNADDTKSLRLYLRGGKNRLVCHGPVGRSIKIDIVGNRTEDVLQGCDAARLRFTEAQELKRREVPLRISSNPFGNVALPTENVPPESNRLRDWRGSTLPNYIARIDSDDGFVAGGGFTHSRFAFGKNPFGQRHKLTARAAPGRSAFEVMYAGVYQHFNPKLQFSLNAGISSIREADFFGFGNDTSDAGGSDFFETDQTRSTITPGVDYLLSAELSLFSGAEFNFNSTDDNDNSLLNDLAPLGVGEFGWISLFGGIDYDTRERSVLNSPGVHVRVQGSFSPTGLDVDSSFTSVEGEAEGFIKVGTGSLLAVRVGGRNVSGEFPFQEAAYIGGRNNVRGLETNRFAGEASVFGSVEFRGALRKAPAYLAGAEYGWFIFADAGRVFVDENEGSDQLHPSAGVGVSAQALDGSVLLSWTIARSEEQTNSIFNAGISF